MEIAGSRQNKGTTIFVSGNHYTPFTTPRVPGHLTECRMGRIVIADPHPLIRQGARLLLERAGHEVLAETADGLDAIRHVRQLQAEILILEFRLHRLNGLEVLRRLRHYASAVHSLVYSAIDSAASIALATEAGAAGFVSKAGAPEELVAGVRALGLRRTYFPMSESAGAAPSPEAERLLALSPRELTVMRYLAEGMRMTEIAERLLLSDRTIGTYKTRLMKKLNVRTLIELGELVRRYETGEAAGQVSGGDMSSSGGMEMRSVVDALPVPATLRDSAGRVLYANDRARLAAGEHAELTGTSLEEVLAQFSNDARQSELLTRRFTEAVKHDAAYGLEWGGIRDDGRVFLAHHWGAPVHNADGERVAMLCGTIDVTPREALFVTLRDEAARATAFDAARHTLLLDHYGALSRTADILTEIFNVDAAASAAVQAESAGALWARFREQLDDARKLLTMQKEAPALSQVCLDTETQAIVKDWHDRGKASPTLEWQAEGAVRLPVWVNRTLYRELVRSALNSVSMRTEASLRVTLQATVRSTGLLAVQLAIAGQKISDRPDERYAVDASGMASCEAFAREFGARLQIEHIPARIVRLSFEAPRASGAVQEGS